MNKFNRVRNSIILKCSVIILVIFGISADYIFGAKFEGSRFLYFTIQSNIWIAVIDLIFIYFLVRKYRHPLINCPTKLYIIHQVFTISITLTGFVYSYILVPMYFISEGFVGSESQLTISTIVLHLIVPKVAVVDYVYSTRSYIYGDKDYLYALIPPVYYFGLTTIGYFCNWNFGNGLNFPYFFLNFGSPAGLIGFSGELPYLIGSLYWILIIFVIILGLSFLSNKAVNKLTIKYINNY